VAQGAAVPVISTLGLGIPIVYVFSAIPCRRLRRQPRPAARQHDRPHLHGSRAKCKRLELLRDIVPELRRVAIVANPEHPGEHLERAYTEETGRSSA